MWINNVSPNYLRKFFYRETVCPANVAREHCDSLSHTTPQTILNWCLNIRVKTDCCRFCRISLAEFSTSHRGQYMIRIEEIWLAQSTSKPKAFGFKTWLLPFRICSAAKGRGTHVNSTKGKQKQCYKRAWHRDVLTSAVSCINRNRVSLSFEFFPSFI